VCPNYRKRKSSGKFAISGLDDSDSSTDDEGSSCSKFLNRGGAEAAKRKRHRSRNISITIRYGSNATSESSSEETIYSAQGYETAAICDDVSDDDSSDASTDDQAQNDVYNEENIYRVISNAFFAYQMDRLILNTKFRNLQCFFISTEWPLL